MTDVIFFGLRGIFSLPPLQALVETGVEVSAVLMPTSTTGKPLPRRIEPLLPPPSDLPIITPHLSRNIIHVAWEHHLPAWEVGSLSDARTLELLADLQPDLIVVACFPYIFPPTLLELPRYGCLNLHPSLLPAYRGPLPLFWMARQGEHRAGVTLHFLDEGLDTGDIVAQTAFDWPDGISGIELEQHCAEEGAKLLSAAVEQLAQGGELPRRPQPEQGSSYFSWPTEQDFVIPTHWEARRAFNFLRAAEDWPLVIEVGEEMRRRGGGEARERGGEEAGRWGGEERFLIRAVVSFDTQAALDQPYLVRDDELWVQFTPGVLRAKI